MIVIYVNPSQFRGMWCSGSFVRPLAISPNNPNIGAFIAILKIISNERQSSVRENVVVWAAATSIFIFDAGLGVRLRRGLVPFASPLSSHCCCSSSHLVMLPGVLVTTAYAFPQPMSFSVLSVFFSLLHFVSFSIAYCYRFICFSQIFAMALFTHCFSSGHVASSLHAQIFYRSPCEGSKRSQRSVHKVITQ